MIPGQDSSFGVPRILRCVEWGVRGEKERGGERRGEEREGKRRVSMVMRVKI